MRQHFYHLVICLLLFSLPVVAADQDPQKVIARGYAGSLTVDAFDACYEEPVFSLGEVGQLYFTGTIMSPKYVER